MFDHVLQAEVKRVEVLVPKVDGPVAKACRITFRRELDHDIARALGGEFGVAALKQLDNRGITKIEFPIDAISARCEIAGKGTPLEIAVVTGITAVAKVKKLQEKKDPEVPTVELKFQFSWAADAWVFLGENACTTVTITLSRNQLELPLAGAANGNGEKRSVALTPAKKGRKKGGTLTTKSSHGHDHAEAAGEIADDPQDAATPEEAEEIRAQRLREERASDEGVWTGGAH